MAEGQARADDASGRVYVEERHHDKCCAKMEELWRTRELCDIRLMVSNEEGTTVLCLPAHRLVLAANIPYFRAMFTSEMLECSQPEVTLLGVDSGPLKQLVEWAYTGRVEITEANVQGLLATASLLELPRIVGVCASFIAGHLNVTNCLGVQQFAALHGLRQLAEAAERFALDNFAAVASEPEFLGLSLSQLEAMVEGDGINVQGEEEVYAALTRWLQSDPEERTAFADQLYGHVRFPILPLQFLRDVVQENQLLASTAFGQLSIQEALDYHANPASAINFTNPLKVQPRSSVMGAICVVGGAGDAGQSLNETALFSPHQKSWLRGSKMLHRRSRLALALMHGELFAVGGCDLSCPLDTVEKYSPKLDSWGAVAAMGTARRGCAAVVTHRGLVVMGGFSGSVFLRSVEFYDAALDEWSFGPPMLEARSDLCAVHLEQRIYAIGGVNTSSQLRSVECFDLLNRKWEKVADMVAPRASAGESTEVCPAAATELAVCSS